MCVDGFYANEETGILLLAGVVAADDNFLWMEGVLLMNAEARQYVNLLNVLIKK